MDLTSHVLVVLGLAAGAAIGAFAVAGLLAIVGVDANGLASQLLMAAAGAGGAVVGARVNHASGRALLAERAADLA
jgi:hypothetical protein